MYNDKLGAVKLQMVKVEQLKAEKSKLPFFQVWSQGEETGKKRRREDSCKEVVFELSKGMKNTRREQVQKGAAGWTDPRLSFQPTGGTEDGRDGGAALGTS